MSCIINLSWEDVAHWVAQVRVRVGPLLFRVAAVVSHRFIPVPEERNNFGPV